jgi:hypothetical protein
MKEMRPSTMFILMILMGVLVAPLFFIDMSPPPPKLPDDGDAKPFIPGLNSTSKRDRPGTNAINGTVNPPDDTEPSEPDEGQTPGDDQTPGEDENPGTEPAHDEVPPAVD